MRFQASGRSGISAVRNHVEARACGPPPDPLGVSSPVSTVSRSRNGSSGCRIGVNSNPVPAAAGVQFCITMPLGT